MAVHIEDLLKHNSIGIERHTVVDGKSIDSEKIVPCDDIVDRCDVKYPKLPCWQACGYSYLHLNGIVTCRNSEMVKRLYGIDVKPKRDERK